MEEYICKIASLKEMEVKWNYEIDKAIEDKNNWIIWKKNNIDNFLSEKIIPYYGILNGKIICEATVQVDKEIIQNSDGLIDDETVYLSAFRTIKKYQGQGYFSKLFKFMIEDLKSKGYKKATLGVEPEEKKNYEIYQRYGFTKFIKTGVEVYPDGTRIDVNYYLKEL